MHIHRERKRVTAPKSQLFQLYEEERKQKNTHTYTKKHSDIKSNIIKVHKCNCSHAVTLALASRLSLVTFFFAAAAAEHLQFMCALAILA